MIDDELEHDINLGEKKKSSGLLWIIISAVLALMLIVVATLYFLGEFSFDGATDEGSEPAEASEAAEARISIYHTMDPFTVNFRDGGGARLMQVTLAMLVRSEDTVNAIQKHDPVIRNNFLLLLSGQDPVRLRTREGKEELRNHLRKEIRKILEQRTGDQGIEEIFFTGFVMQ